MDGQSAARIQEGHILCWHMLCEWVELNGGLVAEFSPEAVTAQLLEDYQRFARRRAPVGDKCAAAQ